jgi:heat shock protein beta
LNEDYKSVKDYLETLLAGKVQKVKMTDLLSESPAALVQSAYGMSPTMQRYMKAQNVAVGGADVGSMGSFNQAVLEVNPSHPIVQDLEGMIKSEGVDSDRAKNYGTLLFDVAALTSGYEIEDSGDFAQRILTMMTGKAKGDIADAVVEEVKVDTPEATTSEESSSEE